MTERGRSAPRRARPGAGAHQRATARPRRGLRLPRLTPHRAAAALGILVALGGLYGLAATPAFSYARAEIPELRWATRAEVEAAMAVPRGTNLFQLTVAPIEERLRALPMVADATVRVALPDALVVEIQERTAILSWSVGERRLLVDASGVIFAVADPGAVTAAGLPVVDDTREASAALAVGSVLDPVDLDAATRLGSLEPADVGSAADALLVTVSDATGYVVGTSPPSWIAVFGLYTPSQRRPDMIADQVRLLRSLLAARGEATVAQVILADADSGTVTLKPTPAPE